MRRSPWSRRCARSICIGWRSRSGRRRITRGWRRCARPAPSRRRARTPRACSSFAVSFELGALDVAQPSVTKIGGISAMRRIIALAQEFGVRVVPHCPYFGPGFIASLHIAAALPADTPVERLAVDLEASPFGDWIDAKDGHMRVPQGPGLGVDPDPALIARYRTHEPNIIR